MKVDSQYSEPETVTERQPYRLRIEGSDGQAIEVVENMTGGFMITVVGRFGAVMTIRPVAANAVVVKETP